MPPRVTGVAAFLSLMLCVATLAWWARSFLPPDLHVGARDGRLVLVFADPALTRHWQSRGGGSGSGKQFPVRAAELWAQARRGRSLRPTAYFVPAGSPSGFPAQVANKAPQISDYAGVAVALESGPYSDQYKMIAVSLLCPAAVLTLPPAAWLALTLRRRRRTRACARCGYDLRGTPHRCPECGTKPRHDVPTRTETDPPDAGAAPGPPAATGAGEVREVPGGSFLIHE